MPETTRRQDALPEGWEAKRLDGQTVYINHVAKTTQWEKPTRPAASCLEPLDDASPEPELQGPAESSSQSSDGRNNGPPAGWIKKVTKDGYTFYVNMIETATYLDAKRAEKTASQDPSRANGGAAAAAAALKYGSDLRIRCGRRPPSIRSSTCSTVSNSSPEAGEGEGMGDGSGCIIGIGCIGSGGMSSGIMGSGCGGDALGTNGGQSANGDKMHGMRDKRAPPSTCGRRYPEGSNDGGDSNRCRGTGRGDRATGSSPSQGWNKAYTDPKGPNSCSEHGRSTAGEKMPEILNHGSAAGGTRGSSRSSSSTDEGGRPIRTVASALTGEGNHFYAARGKPHNSARTDRNTTESEGTETSDRGRADATTSNTTNTTNTTNTIRSSSRDKERSGLKSDADEQSLPQQKHQAHRRAIPGQSGVPTAQITMPGGVAVITGLGTGMNFMMKRMTTPPVVEPRTEGHLGMNRFGLTDMGKCESRSLKPAGTEKQPQTEGFGFAGGKAGGKSFVKDLNKGTNSGLELDGASAPYKVNLKMKRGGLKFGGKSKDKRNRSGSGFGSKGREDNEEEEQPEELFELEEERGETEEEVAVEVGEVKHEGKGRAGKKDKEEEEGG